MREPRVGQEMGQADPSAGGPGGAFWAVIPAGGAGTRLWPLSRAERPKFLLPLLDERSLLQQTVDRLAPLADRGRTLVVCGPAHAAAVTAQLPELPPAHVVVEPTPKGSGPAIGLAAAIVARQDPDAVMGSFAADHDVRDEPAFRRAVRAAIGAARAGWLTTVGLTPTRAETGYGYVERTDEVVAQSADGTAYRAARFVEKPDAATAAKYMASGRYLWNASMFVWQARTLMAELARLQPELHAGLTRIAADWGTPGFAATLAEVWAGLPESTIDEGVMERAARVATVPAELGWSDVGDWHGLGALSPTDPAGNSGRGERLLLETTDSVVWSETGRLVCLLGLDGIVVVDTGDALLVTSRDRAQDVRKIVRAIGERGLDHLG